MFIFTFIFAYTLTFSNVIWCSACLVGLIVFWKVKLQAPNESDSKFNKMRQDDYTKAREKYPRHEINLEDGKLNDSNYYSITAKSKKRE